MNQIPSVSEIKSYLESLLTPEQKGAFDNIKYPAVIAGGAVANFIYNKVNNGQAPINDIDIFIFQKKSESEVSKNLDGAVVDYVDEIGSDNTFKIDRTERDGLINYIYVHADYLDSIENLTKTLINDFDINATKAGVMLKAMDDFPSFLNEDKYSFLDKKEELYVNEEFLDFLKSKELRTFKTKTPIKTMMRLLKKKKEFNAFLNEKHLEAVFQLSRGRRTKITDENYLKFKEEIEILKPYFRFFKMTGGIYKSWAVKEYLKLHRSEKLIMKDKNLKKYLVTIFDWQLSGKKSYAKYEKIRPFYHTLKSYITKNLEEVVKQDFNPKDLIYLEKILRKIQVTSKYFRSFNLRDSLSKAKTLNRYLDIEQEICLAFLGHLPNLVSVKLDLEGSYKTFKKEYLDSRKPLNIAYPLTSALTSSCKELNSQEALASEGREMSHCVGGYAKKVEDNVSRIFSIKTDEGSSTLELGVFADHVRGIQHRGKRNSFPDKKNREVAFDLIKHINIVIFNNKPEETPQASGDDFLF